MTPTRFITARHTTVAMHCASPSPVNDGNPYTVSANLLTNVMSSDAKPYMRAAVSLAAASVLLMMRCQWAQRNGL